MTANDSVGMGVARIFAFAEKGGGCSGSMTGTQNEVWSYRERVAFRGDDERVYVTRKTWSRTTSRHVGWVRYQLSRARYITDGTEDTEEWEVWRQSGT